MNINDVNQQLENLASCGDPAFAQAAQQIAQMVQAAQTGSMSFSDLAQVLQDMQRQLEIIQDANQIAFKETLNTCINGLLMIMHGLG
jgi:hypothetical protein